MLNVSTAFREELNKDNRAYIERAKITLASGKVLNLTNENFWNNGFTIEDAVSSDSTFQVGAAIINRAVLVLNNIYGDFSAYDFLNATIVLSVGLMVDGTAEVVQKGVYTVVDPPNYNGDLITIECLDNMRKLDIEYSESTLKYPATLDTIVRDACTVAGVSLNTYDFPHKDHVVQERPDDENLTVREIIGYVAQIAGCFARCNNEGKLELKWYDQTSLKNKSGKIHNISSLYSEDISMDDVVITGIRISVKTEAESSSDAIVTCLEGTKKYLIDISNNALITTDTMKTIAKWLGSQLIGLTFRKASVTHSSDPSIEAGDVALITDRKSNKYPIVVSSTKFSIGSAQRTVSAAETPSRNSAARYNADVKNYVLLHKQIQAEKSAREQLEDDMREAIGNAQGMYETQVEQEDGGVITYIHNKPELEDSDIRIMISSVGVNVTPDAGVHWYGLNVNGDLIARILAVTGIHADWINTGQLVIRNNNKEMLFADVDTGEVRIAGDAINISSGDYMDQYIISANQRYVDQQVQILQDQIDGAIETYYYDHEPTITSEPTVFWTTDEEREKHVGDIFYWRSRGYAYRYMRNDEDTGYEWRLIQDSDITTAIAKADSAERAVGKKITTYAQEAKPTADLVKGDIWIDTKNGNLMYRWDGEKWVNVRDKLMVDAQNAAAAAQKAAETAKADIDSTKALVEELEKEQGRNILRGTSDTAALTASGEWKYGLWRSASGGTGTRASSDAGSAPSVNIFKEWRLTNASKDSAKLNCDIAQDNVEIIGASGRTYTISCYAKGTGKLLLQQGYSKWQGATFTLDKVSTWTRYRWTFNVDTKAYKDSNNKNVYYVYGNLTNIYFGNRGIGTIEICGMMLEQGRIVHNYTTSSEEGAIKALKDSMTQQQIFNTLTNNGATQGIYLKSGKLYINGSYIQAGTVSANYLRTGLITDKKGLSKWNLDSGVMDLKLNSLDIKTGKLTWTSTYSSMTAGGKLWCKGAEIDGKIISTATNGISQISINGGYMNAYGVDKKLEYSFGVSKVSEWVFIPTMSNNKVEAGYIRFSGNYSNLTIHKKTGFLIFDDSSGKKIMVAQYGTESNRKNWCFSFNRSIAVFNAFFSSAILGTIDLNSKSLWTGLTAGYKSPTKPLSNGGLYLSNNGGTAYTGTLDFTKKSYKLVFKNGVLIYLA